MSTKITHFDKKCWSPISACSFPHFLKPQGILTCPGRPFLASLNKQPRPHIVSTFFSPFYGCIYPAVGLWFFFYFHKHANICIGRTITWMNKKEGVDTSRTRVWNGCLLYTSEYIQFSGLLICKRGRRIMLTFRTARINKWRVWEDL